MDFKQFITEAPEKTAAFAFGRFNPPTVGHEKLIKKVKSVADEHNADAHIVASHSEGTSKDPVPVKAKVGYLKHVAPEGTKVSIASKESPSFLHTAAKLHSQGYKHLVMVAGSDRTEEYHKLLHKYNNVAGKHGHYNFKSIKVVSAGQRDPDAEGVEGMSGTKMRAHARAGEMKQFKSGLPKALHPHAEEIANHIKAVKEDFENPYRHDWGTPEGTLYMQKMTPGEQNKLCSTGSVWSNKQNKCVPIREAYHAQEIFKLGQIVESNKGDAGEIVYRGSTYVTIQLESGKTVKHWLKDIKESNKIININRLPSKVNENSVPIRKIPALLMSKEQLHEMTKNNLEISYEGYKTENLHMCPDASIQLKSLIARAGVSPKFVLQAIMATDQYLGIEKEAIANGFADEYTVHQFAMKLSIAHDTLNALEYPDKQLTYMTKHIQTMSKLSMHRDGTFANETGLVTVETQPEGQGGGVEEGYDTSDYRIVIGKDGKKYKVPAGRIITDREEKMTESKMPLASFRELISKNKVNEQSVETPESPTHARDINFKDEKDVFHGIDKHIEGQSVDGKPVGMVSFKAFMNAPETQKIAAQHAKDRQDVHRGQVEIAQQHSPAYKQMTKAAKQDL